jgi:hypothetical protein
VDSYGKESDDMIYYKELNVFLESVQSDSSSDLYARSSNPSYTPSWGGTGFGGNTQGYEFGGTTSRGATPGMNGRRNNDMDVRSSGISTPGYLPNFNDTPRESLPNFSNMTGTGRFRGSYNRGLNSKTDPRVGGVRESRGKNHTV